MTVRRGVEVRSSAAARRVSSGASRPGRAPAATAAIWLVSRRLAVKSTCIPNRDWPVWARIWVRPAAPAGSAPAMICGRPALSTNTRPSSRFGLMLVPAVARSISPRNAATRPAVASTPPGLLTNSACALPEAARVTNSASRAGT